MYRGFKKQFKTMFKPIRVVATVLMLASIVMCFVAAFLLPTVLCILFVIVRLGFPSGLSRCESR